MPTSRKPCYCSRCNGAIVSTRTVFRHTKQRSSVVPFSDWHKRFHRKERPSNDHDSSDGNDSESESDSDTGAPGPGCSEVREEHISKRRRYNTMVCLCDVCAYIPSIPSISSSITHQ